MLLIAGSTAFLAYTAWQSEQLLAEQRIAQERLGTFQELQIYIADLKSTAFAAAITRRKQQEEAFNGAKDNALQTIEKLSGGEFEKVAKRLQIQVAAFSTVMQDVQKGLRKKNRNPAIAKFRNDLIPLIEAINTIIVTQLNELETQMAMSAERVDANNAKMTQSALVLLAVALVFGIAMSILLIRAIAGPIKKLCAAMASVEQESDLTKRCTVKSKDELGEMAYTFNSMLDKFQDIIAKVGASTQSVTTSAQKMAAISEQSRDSIEQQRLSSDSISSAVTQLASSAEEMANSAQQAAEAAEHARTEVGQGKEVVTNTIESVDTMADQMRDAVTAMETLSDKSKRIETVMQTIETIADQTNLLALNASIESARAGEHGRGFSIVATEVRELANQVQASTRETRELVDGLQRSASHSLQIIQQGHETIQHTVAQADKTSQALDNINSAVDTISTMNQDISHATEEQGRVTEEINVMVSTIHQLTTDSAEDAEQVAAASDELSGLATQLQDLVSRFKA